MLGDRISLSWYKDIRKARGSGAFENLNYRRGGGGQQWPPDRYNDYRQGGGGYGRGGPRGGGGYRGANQRSGWYPRGNEYSEGGARSRRYTRSSSRSQSRSPSAHSRSHSAASRSSSREQSRSHSDDSRTARKRRRSTSDVSNRRARTKASSASKAAANNRAPSSSGSASDQEAGSHSDSASPATDKKKKSRKMTDSVDRTSSAGRDSKVGMAVGGAEGAESEAEQFVGDDMTSPPPQPVPAPGSKASRAALRSAVVTAATGRKTKTLDDSAETAGVAMSVDSGVQPVSKKLSSEGKAGKKKRGVVAAAGDDVNDDVSDDADYNAARNNTDDFNRESDAVDYMYADSGPPPAAVAAPTKRSKGAGNGTKKMKTAAAEFDPFDDEEDAVLAEQGLSKHRRTDGGRAAGPAGKRMVPGAVGLSYEKMQMVRQKKEEIEKAYRQDCETFATVTKMLISKEPCLEEKIQNSLRENLKDIGHRCIQELRDFIERLKDDQLTDV